MYDFHVVVFQHYTGSEPAAWPALWSGSAPRDAHRQRRRETLLVVTDFFGSARPDLRAQERLLQRATVAYFQTDGPVTAALKALAWDLHQRLRRANERLAARGKQVLARMAVWVWRGPQVYLALIGPWQVYALAPSLRIFPPEPENWGPPIGLTDEPWVDYYSLSSKTSPWLLAAEPLPANVAWDQLLGPDPKPALEELLGRSAHPLRGLWLDVQPGSARLHRENVQQPWSGRVAAAHRAAASSSVPADAPSALQPSEPSSPARSPRAEKDAATSDEASPVETAHPSSTRRRPETPPRKKKRKKVVASAQPTARTAKVRKSTSRAAWAWLRPVAAGLQRVSAWVPRLPTGLWLFLAIVVPLAVIAASVAVYVRRGNTARQARWLQTAEQYVVQAQAATDPLAQREAWAQALAAVEEAARYGDTPRVQALRQEVQQGLDALDGTRRLAFAPLIEDGVGNVRFIRLAVGMDDLYALDETQNQIKRFRWPGGDAFRYEPDAQFVCQARRYGTLDLGPLVDVAALPPARYDFRVVTVDQGGVLLTCDPEEGAQARPLPRPPQGWGRIQRAHVWEHRLYLLDAGTNAFYSLDLARLATAVPQPLLDAEQAAPDFQNVVDFALLGGEAYFLFVDTQVVRCRYFTEETQPCQALEYQDERPGRGNGAVFPEARFTQIVALARPEPSLYLLDPAQQAVYRFSLALRFVEQYRPREPLPEVTGFALGLGPDGADYLYLLAPDQIYAAPLR